MNIKESTLHQIAARYILGEDIEIKISGTETQLHCLQELLNVSRELKQTLDENKNLEKVNFLIKEKKELTKQFQNLTGMTWFL